MYQELYHIHELCKLIYWLTEVPSTIFILVDSIKLTYSVYSGASPLFDYLNLYSCPKSVSLHIVLENRNEEVIMDTVEVKSKVRVFLEGPF